MQGHGIPRPFSINLDCPNHLTGIEKAEISCVPSLGFASLQSITPPATVASLYYLGRATSISMGKQQDVTEIALMKKPLTFPQIKGLDGVVFRYSHSATGAVGQKLINFNTSSRLADSK